VFHDAQSGNLSGDGVPGGIGSKKNDGGGIAKGMGVSGSIMPKGTMGKVQEQAGDIKSRRGQAQGREASDGVSVRQAPGMKTAIDKAAHSQDQAKGVQSQDGAIPHQTQVMRKAIGDATSNLAELAFRGAEDTSLVGGEVLLPSNSVLLLLGPQ
jgi:hypothetical protein